jgi:hypothetical protein
MQSMNPRGMGGFVTASASAEQVNAVRGGLAEDEGGAVDDFGVRVEEAESKECSRAPSAAKSLPVRTRLKSRMPSQGWTSQVRVAGR